MRLQGPGVGGVAVTQGRNFEAAQRCKRSADSLAPPLGGGVQVPGVAVSSHLSLSLLISGVTFHQRQDLGFWTLPAWGYKQGRGSQASQGGCWALTEFSRSTARGVPP